MVDTTLSRNVPGFQIAPEIADERHIIPRLEEIMGQHIPGFRFARPIYHEAGLGVRPHSDADSLGITAHVSLGGTGRVLMRCRRDDTFGQSLYVAKESEDPHKGIERHGKGPLYGGRLTPGIITIIRQHTYTDRIHAYPAIHWFIDDPGQVRPFRKYECTPPRNDKDQIPTVRAPRRSLFRRY
jgi:hypothetical protein